VVASLMLIGWQTDPSTITVGNEMLTTEAHRYRYRLTLGLWLIPTSSDDSVMEFIAKKIYLHKYK
jgi:hypothetical protein